ncbi:MAG: hypothetical protein ACC707_20645 [Thiohalomonadales bacterium]
MYANTPVYSEQNGVHFINIYTELEDGTFRRTQDEPLRLLRNNIKGISIIQGELLTPLSDRTERSWNSATVTFHYGRPQSIYRFLRGMVAKNKFFVFSKPQLSGRISKFNLHELVLKPGTSQRHRSLLKEKYLQSIQLWTQQEWELKQEEMAQAKQATNLNATPTSLDVDFGQAHKKLLAQNLSSDNIDLKKKAQLTFAQSRQQTTILAEGLAPSTPVQGASIKRIGEVSGTESDDPIVRQFPERAGDRRSHFLQRFIFTVD